MSAVRLRRYGFLLALAIPALPVLALASGTARALAAWLPLLFVFGLVPLLDALLGHDRANPDAEQARALNAQAWYRSLALACAPAWLALLGWATLRFAQDAWGVVGALGWVLSLGTIGGVTAINVAHELIHKSTRVEQWTGGVLLASVCYGGFKIEHIFGHHVDVATPRDGSTARLGESAYAFVARALRDNPRRAWALQRARLARRGVAPGSWRNELCWWHGLSVIFAATAWTLGGAAGLGFFLAQSLVAVGLLEIVNYLEHYGLARRRLPDGRYERVSPMHSWNSDARLTNLMLLHLQRHADHHAHAARRYALLRHHTDAPQLPAGYAAMVWLALAPPLWRRVMDPRVALWRARLDDHAPQ